VKLQHPTNQILVSIICSLQQNKQSIGVFIPHMGNAPPSSNFAMIFEDISYIGENGHVTYEMSNVNSMQW
jgi:hypothetical protein